MNNDIGAVAVETVYIGNSRYVAIYSIIISPETDAVCQCLETTGVFSMNIEKLLSAKDERTQCVVADKCILKVIEGEVRKTLPKKFCNKCAP